MDITPVVNTVIALAALVSLTAIKGGKVKHGDKKTNDNSKESEDS